MAPEHPFLPSPTEPSPEAQSSDADRFLAADRTPGSPAPSPVPNGLRVCLTRLERTRPELTARMAAYWWFRPPAPPSVGRRRRHVPTGGWPLSWHLPAIGSVRGWEFGPDDGPVALLVHGWGGWWEQLAAHVEPLVALGFRVVAVDCPGHGSSRPRGVGRRAATVPEMAGVIAAVAGRVGPVRIVVTHSLGTMATVRSLTAHGLQCDAVVTIAPAIAAAPALTTFLSALGLGAASRRHLMPLLESRIGMSLDTCDISPAAAGIAADRGRPLLAIHDRDDRHISAGQAKSLVAVWPGAELMLTTGLGHHRVLRDSAVVDRVAEFAARHRS